MKNYNSWTLNIGNSFISMLHCSAYLAQKGTIYTKEHKEIALKYCHFLLSFQLASLLTVS